MKPETTLSVFFTTVLAALAILAFSGCGTLDKMYDQEVVTEPGAVVSTNIIYRTNVIVLPATTNAATGEVTAPKLQQVVQPEVTYVTGPPILKTNLVPRPSVTSSIGVSQILPLPWVGFAGTALAALYAMYANLRNRRTAQALVTGIEAGRKLLQETPEGQKLDAKIKEKLVEHQEMAGVIDVATKLVQQYTGKTTK